MAGTDIVADRSRRTDGWGRAVFGTVFAGFGTAFAVGGAVSTLPDTNFFTLVPAAMGALFGVIGATMAISGIRKVWLSHLFGIPTLTVPVAEPLGLGGVLVARYHRRGGASRARRSAHLTAELVCEEHVTYRQGTDTHTAKREVHLRELSATRDPSPGTIAGQIVVEVPVDAPPSLTLRNNRIVWSVRVCVRTEGFPDDVGTFVVPVLPVVTAAAFGARP